MKNRFVSSVLASSLLVVLSVALGYAGSTARFNVTVPFAFTAGNVAYPSGDYRISQTLNGFLEIQNMQGNRTSLFSTRPGGSSGQYANPSIQFHRYTDQYFLFKVSSGFGVESLELPVSRLEKDFIGAARTVANNSLQPEVFVVASR